MTQINTQRFVIVKPPHYCPGDIERRARRLVDRYGEGSLMLAGLCADDLFKLGDYEGHAEWLAIQRVAQDLVQANDG